MGLCLVELGWGGRGQETGVGKAEGADEGGRLGDLLADGCGWKGKFTCGLLPLVLLLLVVLLLLGPLDWLLDTTKFTGRDVLGDVSVKAARGKGAAEGGAADGGADMEGREKPNVCSPNALTGIKGFVDGGDGATKQGMPPDVDELLGVVRFIIDTGGKKGNDEVVKTGADPIAATKVTGAVDSGGNVGGGGGGNL